MVEQMAMDHGLVEPARVIMVWGGLGECSVIAKGCEMRTVWQYN